MRINNSKLIDELLRIAHDSQDHPEKSKEDRTLPSSSR